MTGDRTPRKPMAGWSRAAQAQITGVSIPEDREIVFADMRREIEEAVKRALKRLGVTD
jgi:hypothetical protein